MRHLIDINALDEGVPRKLLDTAKFYKNKGRGLLEGAPLLGRTLAMIFEKPSTRTRISFEVAMTELGGSAIYLDSRSMQMRRGETIQDTAKVLGRYLDGIMIRAISHKTLLEMATHSNIPVINGLTDLSHPCQTLADIMTFEENLGPIKGRIIAWIGDGNNMANSWIHAASVFNFTLRLACAKGRQPNKNIIKWAKSLNANVVTTEDPIIAVKNSDAIVTDTWVSMGDESISNPEKIDDELKDLCPLELMLISRVIPFMFIVPKHKGA